MFENQKTELIDKITNEYCMVIVCFENIFAVHLKFNQMKTVCQQNIRG